MDSRLDVGRFRDQSPSTVAAIRGDLIFWAAIIVCVGALGIVVSKII